ncbi:hypothetical protein H8356DRAFT_1331148 [Neocallimastix lanati (nom. inval.)]|nr:hypothetical protein H8356DRAFT_1331148 [Neocallimastix sp. JGI-2020a]
MWSKPHFYVYKYGFFKALCALNALIYLNIINKVDIKTKSKITKVIRLRVSYDHMNTEELRKAIRNLTFRKFEIKEENNSILK